MQLVFFLDQARPISVPVGRRSAEQCVTHIGQDKFALPADQVMRSKTGELLAYRTLGAAITRSHRYLGREWYQPASAEDAIYAHLL
jgi:hypothetical protein